MTTSTDRPGTTGATGSTGVTGRDEDATQRMPAESPWSGWDEPSGNWMLPGGCPDRRERTLVLEAAARILFPTVLVFSVYLLFEGHYGPGGGFSGGLVAGLAFVLRHIAGGDDNLGSRFRVRPPILVGAGLMLAVLTGLAPLAWGEPILSSSTLRLEFGAFGYLDLVSSLLLDVGVYLLIIGVVLDLLRSLGSGIARDAREAGEDATAGRDAAVAEQVRRR